MTEIDPEIARFVAAVSKSYTEHPPFDTLSRAEQRAVAEAVRAPWAAGGPRPASTTDRVVDLPEGTLTLRIHAAAQPGGPALVYLHGGGWVIFSNDTHDRIMREYAERTGYTVIGVNYPLSPEHKFPTALNAVAAFLPWLAAHAEEFGIDASRIALGGDSVGANLSLSTALQLRDAGRPDLIKALVLNYGAFDTSRHYPSHAAYGDGRYLLSSDEMDGFWAAYTSSEAERNHIAVAPIRADLCSMPPTHLCITELDVLHDESMDLAQRLIAAGVMTDWRVYPGTVHSFLEAVSIAQVSRDAFDHASAWLTTTLGNRSR